MMESFAINRDSLGTIWKPYLLAAGVIGTLLLYILAWAYLTFPGDESALVHFQTLRTGWLDDPSIWFANLGLLSVFMPAAVILMGCLAIARRYADIAMVFGGLAVVGLGLGLKVLVDRPRPEYRIIEPVESGLSFPSGHSLLAVILGGVLVYLVGQWVRPLLLRRAIQAGLIGGHLHGRIKGLPGSPLAQ